jgi:hypothetical protein
LVLDGKAGVGLGAPDWDFFMYDVETIQQRVKAIATAHADFAKSSFEQNNAYVAQLAQAKSLDKAVELHAHYAKTAYETYSAEADKISDLYKKFAKEAFAPLATVFETRSKASAA